MCMPAVAESVTTLSSIQPFTSSEWNSFQFLDGVRSKGARTALSTRVLALFPDHYSNNNLYVEYELQTHIDDRALRANGRTFGCMMVPDPFNEIEKDPAAVKRACSYYLQLGADHRGNSEEDIESFSYGRYPLGGPCLPEFLSAHFEHGARRCDLSFSAYVEKLENDPDFLASQKAWLLLPAHISINTTEEFKNHEVSGGFSGGIAGFAIAREQFLRAAPALTSLLRAKEKAGDYRLTAVCAGCGPEANEAYGYAMILDNFLRTTAFECAREAGIADEPHALAFAKEWYSRWKLEVVAQSISLEHLANAAFRTERNYDQRMQDWIAEQPVHAEPFLEGSEYFLHDEASRYPHLYRIKTHIYESVRLEWCDLLHSDISARRAGEVDLVVAKRSLYLYSGRNNPKIVAAYSRLVDSLRPGGVLITDQDVTRWPADGLKPRYEASAGLYWSHPDMEEICPRSDLGIPYEKVFKTSAEIQALEPRTGSEMDDDVYIHALGYGAEIDAHEGRIPSGVYIKKEPQALSE